jgi:hypothetical protein
MDVQITQLLLEIATLSPADFTSGQAQVAAFDSGCPGVVRGLADLSGGTIMVLGSNSD